MISVDAKELTDSQVSSPILLDPGVHTIEAAAEGYAKFHKQLRVSEREKATLEIVMTKGEAPVPVPSASAPPVASAAPSATEPEPAPSASAPEPPMTSSEPPPVASVSSGSGKTLGWIALGVGAAGGALAAYGYLKRSSALSDLDSQCGADKQQCPASAQSILDDGKSATTIGNIGLAVGLVGVTTGIILLATSGPQRTGGTEASACAAVCASALHPDVLSRLGGRRHRRTLLGPATGIRQRGQGMRAPAEARYLGARASRLHPS